MQAPTSALEILANAVDHLQITPEPGLAHPPPVLTALAPNPGVHPTPAFLPHPPAPLTDPVDHEIACCIERVCNPPLTPAQELARHYQQTATNLAQNHPRIAPLFEQLSAAWEKVTNIPLNEPARIILGKLYAAIDDQLRPEEFVPGLPIKGPYRVLSLDLYGYRQVNFPQKISNIQQNIAATSQVAGCWERYERLCDSLRANLEATAKNWDAAVPGALSDHLHRIQAELFFSPPQTTGFSTLLHDIETINPRRTDPHYNAISDLINSFIPQTMLVITNAKLHLDSGNKRQDDLFKIEDSLRVLTSPTQRIPLHRPGPLTAATESICIADPIWQNYSLSAKQTHLLYQEILKIYLFIQPTQQ